MTIQPNDMTALAQQAAARTDGVAYLIFFSKEDGWVAIRSDAPGLSGIAARPEAALHELGVAHALATLDADAIPFELPICEWCSEPIRPLLDPPDRRDAGCLTAGTQCGCSASPKPPICMRQGATVYVRVPDAQQNTVLGRTNAVQRIPRAWRRNTPSWRFVDEQQHGAYRWWLFERVPA